MKISIVGVGGAGCNVIIDLHNYNHIDSNLIMVNTVDRDLPAGSSAQFIKIGQQTEQFEDRHISLDIAFQAAFNDKEIIKKSLEGSELVFVLSGMGGAAGSGASCVIAEAANDIGAICVGILTTPFFFEGKHRCRVALEGLSASKAFCDVLIQISAQQLLDEIDPETTLSTAFHLLDKAAMKRRVKPLAGGIY